MSHTPPPGIPVQPEPQPQSPWDLELTSRESEIALYLAEGTANREIARGLGISVKTVDTHRGHILKKLQCKNNVELVRYMIRAGAVKL